MLRLNERQNSNIPNLILNTRTVVYSTKHIGAVTFFFFTLLRYHFCSCLYHSY